MTQAKATPRTLRTLVVDDTALYRRAISDVLHSIEGVEVLGVASNGRLALARMADLQPDLITLDLEMPELNGIEVLEAISTWPRRPGVIVLSSHTAQGSALTMRALELGAFDFVTKPEGSPVAQSLDVLRSHLAPVVKAFACRSALRQAARVGLPHPGMTGGVSAVVARAEAPAIQVARMSATAPHRLTTRKKLVAIGVSTGGPQCLAELLPPLPATLEVPILIVQHMPPLFTQALAESLERKCAITVKEAESREFARSGVAYIAPGGKQMKVKAGPGGEVQILLTDDAPENHCRPAVDYLFRSVALQFPGAAIGLVLTGMGNDGAQGVRLLKKSGSTTLAQDEATSVVFGMPREAIATGSIDEVLPLKEIAPRLVALLELSSRG